MAQNVYDDPGFLAGYIALDRQVRGLDGAAEWPALRAMLPDIDGRRVIDLGCGLGWFSRWASDAGAVSVLGIDISTRMLARARADTSGARVTFVEADLDVVGLAPASADLVFSSLALHYVDDLARLLAKIAAALVPGGSVVFSVEHPIYSAPTTQTFVSTESGDRMWPLDNYLVEGERVRTWFVDGVIKQHRTISTYVNGLVDAGLVIDRMEEWGPSAETVAAQPELADDRHRPWFLLLRATRPPAPVSVCDGEGLGEAG